MDWLRRQERPRDASTSVASPVAAPEAIERTTPGIATFFDGIEESRSHSVLDLGPASEASFRVYSRYARWVRFEDLLEGGAPAGGWSELIDAIPANPACPYDLIFVWGVLNHIPPEDRPRLIERLVEIGAPHARIFVVVESSDTHSVRRLNFSILDVDRMRYEPVGAPHAGWGALLPAETERLLAPFRVVRAFTSKAGLREYVAVLQGGFGLR